MLPYITGTAIVTAIAKRKSTPYVGFSIRHSANFLTTCRVCLSLMIAALLWCNPKSTSFWDNPAIWWNPATDGVILFLLFLTAGLTDYADGKVARALGIVSDFGRMYDKSADKLLIIPAYAFFLRCFVWLWHSHYTSWPSVIMLSFLVTTDILIFIVGSFLGILRIRINTSGEGKQKMKWQCISGSCWILLVLMMGVRMDNRFLLMSIPFLLVLPAFYCYGSAKGYARDAIAAFRAYRAKRLSS